MSTEEELRKLVAIMHADVKGYSRLMGEDESYTVRTLTECRKIFSDNIEKHGGRIVNAPGDSILSEFPSVVSAVRCAAEIQDQLGAKNAGFPDNRKMLFRIGVNLGDVIHREDAIYGDGVNIAARIEALADPGGVSISRAVFNHVHTRLKYGYEYQGEHQVKNILHPVRVYKLLTEPENAGKLIGEPKPYLRPSKWYYIAAVFALLFLSAGAVWHYYLRPPVIESASIDKMAFPLPDKPSIAVLPFDNLSGDPEQDYFSDGLTEEIITALSKVPGIFVISRTSTFTYKGKPVKVQQVAEDLGVRYVLEGSVRKGKDQVRITAQLIDALNGHHLWAERYDRNLKDIFAVQDEITKNILTALQVKLTSGESARLQSKGTENLQAYLKYLQAVEKMNTGTKEGNSLAQNLLEEVVTLDPKFPAAYVLLGLSHTNDVMLGVSKSPKMSFAKATELAKKAIALDDTFPDAYRLVGWILIKSGKYEKAIAECERAVALAPNSAGAVAWLSIALRYAGRHEEALGFAEQAIRLNPRPASFFFRSLGVTYMFNGRYEEAVDNFKKTLNLSPNDLVACVNIAVVYMKAGHENEARAAVAEVLKINPKMSLLGMEKLLNYKKQADNDMYIDALRRAGLPERPSSQ